MHSSNVVKPPFTQIHKKQLPHFCILLSGNLFILGIPGIPVDEGGGQANGLGPGILGRTSTYVLPLSYTATYLLFPDLSVNLSQIIPSFSTNSSPEFIV